MVTEARIWVFFRCYAQRLGPFAGPLLALLIFISMVLEAAVVLSFACIILDCRLFQLVRLAVEKKHLQFDDFCRMEIVDAEVRFGRIQLLAARENGSCKLRRLNLDPVELLRVIYMK